MKRISLAATVLASCLSSALPSAAWAVNPSIGSNNSGMLQSGNTQFGTTTLPGQGYFDYSSVSGVTNDPFLNSSFLNPSLYPNQNGVNNSTIRVIPTTPGLPNTGIGRDRIVPGMTPNFLPPGNSLPNSTRRWRLGVLSKDLDTGVRIHEVVNGGSAHRAGLEVNDLLIAVNGFQVGYVNGQLYDCGTEFNRLADQNGWVSILVQNSRDMRLVNVPVQLTPMLPNLTGSIAMLNRQLLTQGGQNGYCNVELREYANNSSNPIVLASRRIDNLNQYPIPFSIDYDPARLNPNNRYVVYANMIVNGQETLRTPQLIPVTYSNGQLGQVTVQLEPFQQGVPYSNVPVSYNDLNSQRQQIIQWYNDYLGRNPSDRELITYLQQVGQGQQLTQVQASLLSNDQFFNRCNTDKVTYVRRMHEVLIGREPTNEELAYWVNRYDANNGARLSLAQDFIGSITRH